MEKRFLLATQIIVISVLRYLLACKEMLNGQSGFGKGADQKFKNGTG